MLRKNLFYCILLIFSYNIYAQPASYKHLEGKVGNNIIMVMDVVMIGEKLGGYYYYYFDDRSGDASWVHYGKSMPVLGTIKTDQSFEFTEFKPEVKGAIFSGNLENGILNGTWTSSDGNKQLPFQAVENYPLGTMAFRVHYLNKEFPLVDKENSPAAALDLILLLPVDYPDKAIADSVTAIIYQDFFDKAAPGDDPDALIRHASELYANNYRKSNQDIYQEGMASFNWEKKKAINILHNEHDVLSLECYDYGFTGGAHGLSISKFKVIDLKTGRKIFLGEIFRPDYQNDLRDILNNAARKKFKLERSQGLKEAGFYQDQIDPSDNFYLTKDGIGFYYNQYEVAPFALGPVEIFVNYQDILRILSPESPVHRLITTK